VQPTDPQSQVGFRASWEHEGREGVTSVFKEMIYKGWTDMIYKGW
jgi:hypothetical protein